MIRIAVYTKQNISDNISVDDLNAHYLFLLAKSLNSELDDSYVVFFDKHNNDDGFLNCITIRDDYSHKFVIIDMNNHPSFLLGELSNPSFIFGFCSSYKIATTFSGPSQVNKYSPFFAFDEFPNFTKSFRDKIKNQRKHKEKLIPKMVFFNYLHKKIPDLVSVISEEFPELIDIFEYKDDFNFLDVSASYLLSLTVHESPWFLNAVSLWSSGIATISSRYTNVFGYPLLSNVHYLDCNTRGKNNVGDELFPEKTAVLVKDSFLSFKNNYNLISSVEKNAILRYNFYNSTSAAAKYVKKQLKNKLFR
jgi:hypothetical protein